MRIYSQPIVVADWPKARHSSEVGISLQPLWAWTALLLFAGVGNASPAQLTGTYSPQTIVVGGNLRLTYTLSNNGGTPASGTLFTYRLPPSTILVSTLATNGTFAVSNDVFSYFPDIIQPGEKVVLELTLTPVTPGYTTNIAAWAGSYVVWYINVSTVLPGPPMNVGRLDHISTLLLDGRILITGGETKNGPLVGSATDTAEFYDPFYDRFTLTKNMSVPRKSHTATVLQNGMVLVAGGQDAYCTNSMDLFDPSANAFSPTANLAIPRALHTATLLPNGDVILAGGTESTLIERFCFTNGQGIVLSAGNLSTARSGHVAALLPGGEILFAGGTDASHPFAERYSPSTGISVPVGTNGHYLPAVAISQEKVLLHGWMYRPEEAAAFYDLRSNTFVSIAPPAGRRQGATYLTQKNGDVLIAGGLDSALVDIFSPRTGTMTASYPLAQYRYHSSAVEMADGRILITGGTGGLEWNTSEIYAIRLDRDQDGMGDVWELAHHLDPTRRTDAVEDADADGHTNLQEYLAGTDPNDPLSILRIETGYRDANTMRIRFTSVLGRLYRVERTTNVAEQQWDTVAENIPGTGGMVEVIDPLLTRAQQLYRVLLQL